MNRVLFLVAGMLVFGVINAGIYKNETIKKEGERVFLKLAPVDPRSLMQGDYMRLRYEVENDIQKALIPKQRSGQIIIDCAKTCTFVDFYHGQPLSSYQYVMNARFLSHAVQIKPDTFLFQEGHAKFYDKAEYGVFVFDQKQHYLLLDLADEHKKIIHPTTNP